MDAWVSPSWRLPEAVGRRARDLARPRTRSARRPPPPPWTGLAALLGRFGGVALPHSARAKPIIRNMAKPAASSGCTPQRSLFLWLLRALLTQKLPESLVGFPRSPDPQDVNVDKPRRRREDRRRECASATLSKMREPLEPARRGDRTSSWHLAGDKRRAPAPIHPGETKATSL